MSAGRFGVVHVRSPSTDGGPAGLRRQLTRGPYLSLGSIYLSISPVGPTQWAHPRQARPHGDGRAPFGQPQPDRAEMSTAVSSPNPDREQLPGPVGPSGPSPESGR